MDSTKINYIINDLKSCLTTERFEHTLGVAEYAVFLAERFGAALKNKAYLAGLLHDCAKCMPDEILLKILNDNRKILGINDCELINPKTYHAPAGAVVAKEKYNINDDDILYSIRWHTLGRKDMTLLEKIIFLADKIEIRTRPACCREPIAKYLDEGGGLDRAILECYRMTIKNLAERNLTICLTTIDIYNFLLKKFY